MSGGVDLAGREVKVDTAGVAAGARATLCVRPHLVGIGEGPNQLTGTVQEIQWRGSTHRLYVRIGEHDVMADVRELRDLPRRGDEVTLHFAPDDAVLLPAGVGHG